MSGTVGTLTTAARPHRAAAIALCAVVVCVLFAAPAAASAANAYGQSFAGQEKCLSCHGTASGRWQVGTYTETGHAKFITPVAGNSSALVPEASKWPSPSMGGGLSFAADEIAWMLGSPTVSHQYVSTYLNDTSHVLASGQTMNTIAGPPDDYLAPNGIGWGTATSMWENTAKVTTRTYFQSCGGCHFLGVTRPTDTAYTLASGASVTHSTETSYTGVGIQCEACHGTGKAGTSHWTAEVDIVRTKQALESQTCGQCHVTGTAKEKNYTGGTFSGPNGFTPDRKLEDFFDVAGVSYIQTSPNVAKPVIPTSDTKYYPNGSNKGMKHSYYNEWMLTPHARSLRWKDGTLWTPYAQESCLPCHSGEAFLKSLGYGKTGPNDIGLARSSIASDTLDIECAVCHTVHATTGEPLGLRLEAEELCAICHNSLGEEGEELEPGATPHHPHREMRNGYGLIGVPTPAERFMEDTECPQCHMPTTKYALKTHSFEPMLPGNAEAWGVQAGGDSCTPCHTSKTRKQLQADLDEWEESLVELSAEANGAIAAAQARTAATSPQGIDLIGSASTNVAFVAADGSNGAHNYPYAKAGLIKAEYFARAVGAKFTRFGATSYSSTMRMAMLYGSLEMGDGAPAAGEKVTVLARPGGSSSWTSIGSATVGDDGDFGFAVGPKGTTSYKVVWSPKSGVNVYSAGATITFGSKTYTYLSASRIARGRSLIIKGAVSPRHAGAKVTIQYKRSGSSWRRLATRTLSSTSAYSYRWRPRSRGTYYIKTVFAGDPSHRGSTATIRKVTVR